ncbi:DNA recombination protein RmuC [Salinibacterium soli]|uniref:DNA recombination protein RmuC n=1 Tax=Antiquaquibacter soli TaxID=3064523 RepID=A0ABT9BJT7_9MICO|nr:DNA recombination protein RmuC [Protaetiibacter sp. WY-16]MDO7881281.1 DNA recombination protein RmuC [Protaetiibacter sp. WY-16]
MDPLLALLVGLAVGVALGGVIGVLVARSRRADGVDPAVLEARHAAVVAEVRAQEAEARSEVHARLSAALASLETVQQQLVDTQEQYRGLIDRQRADAQAQADREQRDSKVLQALTPVQETLRAMQLKVADLEQQRSQQHGELTQQLRAATESEERLRATAESLASALRNNATRGVWGETQLRTLVESAGLINRVDFTEQSTILSESGSRRPDMVLNLPGGKSIAVDSKVPYNSYIDASAIPATATGEEAARRATLLSQHAKQVRAHVDALSAKNYWTGLEASPEFTMAFIPNESLLSVALEQDPSLLEHAFSKRVLLASPVSFWAALKTVAFTWQQDVLTEDAKRLFDLGKELFGRLATLGEHAEKLRRSLDSTVSSYNQFATSLESRVFVTARKLDALDESKVIPAPGIIENRPKQLTAVELELAALDEIEGVARPELDIPDLPVAQPKKSSKTA